MSNRKHLINTKSKVTFGLDGCENLSLHSKGGIEVSKVTSYTGSRQLVRI